MLTQQVEVGYVGVVQYLWCTCVVISSEHKDISSEHKDMYNAFIKIFNDMWKWQLHVQCTYIHNS